MTITIAERDYLEKFDLSFEQRSPKTMSLQELTLRPLKQPATGSCLFRFSVWRTRYVVFFFSTSKLSEREVTE